MAASAPTSTSTPTLSVIIGVYNDWAPLDHCLRTLSQQTDPPVFEVIVVDDGSAESAPESIRQWARAYALTIDGQPHAGIAAARNRGLQIARGSLLLFVDADCKLDPGCLAALAATAAQSPQHSFFQLHLAGDCSGIVGRSEELRLMTIQNHTLQPNGCIRYLNTAGFALRRARASSATALFNPAARRGEDTLLLVRLMKSGELPLYVANATVQHAVPLSLLQYLRKSVRSAYLEAGTYSLIASEGIRIRVTNRERLEMLSSMWKASKQPSIGRGAWFVLFFRQALPRFVSLVYRYTRSKSIRKSDSSS
jgi:glycosyltransferase involved in cell wall biosynthesis